MGRRSEWRRERVVVALLLGWAAWAGDLPAQDGPGSGGAALEWDLVGEAEVVPGTGGTALRLRSGAATLRGVDMADGVVSWRARTEPARGFVGWRLRIQPDGEHEHFYFRPHKTNLPDATQYAPFFTRGRGSEWQMYHGPGGSVAAAVQDADEGVHMAIVLSGDSAAWFIGHGDEPVLVVPRLAHGAGGGALQLTSTVMAPTRSERPVIVDEIQVRPGVTRPFTVPEPTPPPAGTVTEWGLGEPTLVDEVVTELPPRIRWRAATTEPDGMLLIHRHVDPPEGRSAGIAVAAGLRLEAPDARTVAVELGFSDAATVFLNGRPILTDDRSYAFGERMGLFLPERTVLHLPLRAGENELVVMVADFFGGWGVGARVRDAEVAVGPMR